MIPTVNLEPCRRCGQREVEVSSNEGWFMVECQNCPQRTSNANRSAADAIAEWNRRTPTVNLEAGAGDLVADLLLFADNLDAVSGSTKATNSANLIREAAAQLAAVTAERDSWRSACLEARDGCNQRSDVIRSLRRNLETTEAQLKAARELIEGFCQINCQDAQAIADAQIAARQEAPK